MNRHIALLALVAALAFTLGQVAQFPAARAAEPTANDLLVQIQALQTKVAAIESGSVAPRAAPTTEQAVAALQSQMNAIGQVLTIGASGVTLKSAGSITIDAGTSVLLNANSGMQLHAAANMLLSAKGTNTVKGVFVRLNDGTKPVSHQNGTSATVTVP